jgi:hypothetical protein
MHYKKQFTTVRPTTSRSGVQAKARYRFDALDWIAAFFVTVTPLYIVYRLLWN